MSHKGLLGITSAPESGLGLSPKLVIGYSRIKLPPFHSKSQDHSNLQVGCGEGWGKIMLDASNSFMAS